ncbi:MAG: GH92 family glycosyl hydrolase [Saprospiraceae bacterium]
MIINSISSAKYLLTLTIGIQALLGISQGNKNYIQYVNPLIGTQRMGHTFPGATLPFGAVQLSPDTDTIPYEMDGKYNPLVYAYCAGYQYDDPTIVGFSHTHFSGTGHSDLGDFLIMATSGALQMNPGTKDNPQSGFRSAYSHQNEVASPGYYKVKLDDQNITAEMTTSMRVGFHRYTFPDKSDAHIILDLMSGIYNYPDKNIWTTVRVLNDSTLVGSRQTNGWAKNRTLYFAMTFSRPFTNYGCVDNSEKQTYRGFWRKFNQTDHFPELAGKQLRMHFDFAVEKAEQVMIKFALSPVSTDNALLNLQTEIPHWDFDKTKREAENIWNKQLGKIDFQSDKKDDLINFYTAMYHAALMPTVFMDVNNQYQGLDQNVHMAKGFTNYSSFSIWDTYRAFHPLMNLIDPARNKDFVSSMMAHYDQSVLHMLPIWSHYANDNWCMSGYHSVSILADAIVKGVYTSDLEKAMEACIATSTKRNYEGLGDYMDHGYIAQDKNGVSVSNTLEYAYDDWCIAQIAKKLNKKKYYLDYMARSENWKNVYDASIGFMRPKLSNGQFKQAFDPLKTDGQGFIEGNAWNYSLYVPHDPTQLIATMGGEKAFVRHLDSLFTMELPDKFFAETEDITREGIIGNYVHGNEPAHHVAYLYNWTSQGWKTQAEVRNILRRQYHPGPAGLSGNDDCGQMSAWYIFSALGFYPVSPGSDQYSIGSPIMKEASIQLENGKTLHIVAKNQSDENVYIQSITMNGKPYTNNYFTHDDLISGAEIVFVMGRKKK